MFTIVRCVSDYDANLGVSVNEVLYAVRQCLEKPNFRVGIFIKSPEVRRQCLEFVAHVLNEVEDYNPQGYIFGAGSPITIHNGSQIRFPIPTDNARGHRFYMTLSDDDIDPTIKKTVIEHSIRPYTRVDFAETTDLTAKLLGHWDSGERHYRVRNNARF